jgi:hypothetical protein
MSKLSEQYLLVESKLDLNYAFLESLYSKW